MQRLCPVRDGLDRQRFCGGGFCARDDVVRGED